jgi:hypothetical protein
MSADSVSDRAMSCAVAEVRTVSAGMSSTGGDSREQEEQKTETSSRMVQDRQIESKKHVRISSKIPAPL